MDSDSTSMKIDQLKESNYHAWKIRIQYVRTLNGLKKYLYHDPPTEEKYLALWKKKIWELRPP